MLDLAPGVQPTSRLGCQIVLTDELDGLTVRLPGEADRADRGSAETLVGIVAPAGPNLPLYPRGHEMLGRTRMLTCLPGTGAVVDRSLGAGSRDDALQVPWIEKISRAGISPHGP